MITQPIKHDDPMAHFDGPNIIDVSTIVVNKLSKHERKYEEKVR